jgi:hypothetical protein
MNQKRPLIKTNPYLKDPKRRNMLITRSVLTSSAVEGIYVDLPPMSRGKNSDKGAAKTAAN